jgi:hypothetical protein
MKAILPVVLLSVLSAPAFAENAALVVDLGAGVCGFLDGNGNPAVTTDASFTATQSENGNMLLSCRAHDSAFAASDGRTVHYNGVTCAALNPFYGLMITNHSNVVITGEGNVNLKCHFTLDDLVGP